ncbi:hypothetical protein [Sciscionella sediminilitoris]|uniref:hypothetical protein n=1 Tax=Sciscionella sediminilitoris TaxID=1445613 RepID=UPI0004DEF21E|nr:hypothetical protein [Sciscionella sp. SE31]
MSEKTPEQLLSEALRAKAVQAPGQARAEEQAPAAAASGQDSLFTDNDASFELLSGQDYRLSPELFQEPEPATSPVTSATAKPARPRPRPEPPPLSARWILLLALLLGAAAGAVAGLLTLR